MEDSVRELLARRKDRTIAIVLSEKEKHCDSYLPEEVRREFRKVVLDQINDFYEFSCDLMTAMTAGRIAVNDEYLDRLDEAMSVLKTDLREIIEG